MELHNCCPNSISLAAIPFHEDGHETIPEIFILLLSFLPSYRVYVSLTYLSHFCELTTNLCCLSYLDKGTDRVQVVCLWSEFDDEQYNLYLRLVDSPSETSTSPNQILHFANFIELEEFDFMIDATHHFEDPYLMNMSELNEQTLKLVREIQGAKRCLFQLCKCSFFLWMIPWLVIITRLTRRHVTLLVTFHALMCGQITFKRRGMI